MSTNRYNITSGTAFEMYATGTNGLHERVMVYFNVGMDGALIIFESGGYYANGFYDGTATESGGPIFTIRQMSATSPLGIPFMLYFKGAPGVIFDGSTDMHMGSERYTSGVPLPTVDQPTPVTNFRLPSCATSVLVDRAKSVIYNGKIYQIDPVAIAAQPQISSYQGLTVYVTSAGTRYLSSIVFGTADSNFVPWVLPFVAESHVIMTEKDLAQRVIAIEQRLLAAMGVRRNT